MKVCHLTSVHNWRDTRIFFRECRALSENGYDVHLVAVNAAEGIQDGVMVHSVTSSVQSRLFRATVLCYRIFNKALSVKADLYHFHDPELIWVGFILKLMGFQVIFDIHENIRQQILDKEWLPFRRIVSGAYWVADYMAAKSFKLILAEESYLGYYRKLGSDAIVVQNYPDIKSLSQFARLERTGNGILYVGGVTKIRGIFNMIDALAILKSKGIDFHFHCVGPIGDDLMNEIRNYKNYIDIMDCVTFYGRLSVYESYKISAQCIAGLSLLHPVGNYLYSFSTKIFEYMAVGLPVVVSNFKLYDFITETESGFLVDPNNPDQVAVALEKLLTESDLVRKQGSNGMLYVNKYRSWDIEKFKLLECYSELSHIK